MTIGIQDSDFRPEALLMNTREVPCYQQAPDDIRWTVDQTEFDDLLVLKKDSVPNPDGITSGAYRCAGDLVRNSSLMLIELAWRVLLFLIELSFLSSTIRNFAKETLVVWSRGKPGKKRILMIRWGPESRRIAKSSVRCRLFDTSNMLEQWLALMVTFIVLRHTRKICASPDEN